MNTINAHMALCVMCHKKNDTTLIHQLQHIEQEIKKRNIIPSNKYQYKFMWGINPHCSYGLSCHQLHDIRNKANTIARRIEPYLISIALSDDEQFYYTILQYMRGYFPSVYHLMEHTHMKYKHNNKE